jgi:hypothetical protein
METEISLSCSQAQEIGAAIIKKKIDCYGRKLLIELTTP